MDDHDAPQRFDRQTFFQNECGAQPQRLGAAHRQIVDGAVHRQRADVPAAKNSGFTTNESVVIASRAPFNETMA